MGCVKDVSAWRSAGASLSLFPLPGFMRTSRILLPGLLQTYQRIYRAAPLYINANQLTPWSRQRVVNISFRKCSTAAVEFNIFCEPEFTSGAKSTPHTCSGFYNHLRCWPPSNIDFNTSHTPDRDCEVFCRLNGAKQYTIRNFTMKTRF
jgi:hypothetical protein